MLHFTIMLSYILHNVCVYVYTIQMFGVSMYDFLKKLRLLFSKEAFNLSKVTVKTFTMLYKI